MKLIIASNNPGKNEEYRDILEPFGFQVVSQKQEAICLEVEETGTTFEENALLKARAIYEITHCCVISDDSGLEVEALGGEPGLYSARYKGLPTEHERRLAVLEGLKGSDNRKARFVTCICFIDESGREHLFTGEWNGVIAEKEEGSNGFGYDPIFHFRRRKRQDDSQSAHFIQGKVFSSCKSGGETDGVSEVASLYTLTFIVKRAATGSPGKEDI